jgi:beta-lactamase regulating signal transducer with metallopeptidase domain
MAVGVFCPRILLPSEWPEWTAEKLMAVIAHERAHVERRDCAVILLAEVNRALYWFHPLAWWLRHRLAMLAEEACDDAAINAAGDRAAYSRHLLEVASAVAGKRGRLIQPGISMARQSNVEHRINTILDFRRPLSKRLTWATSLLLIAAIVPMIGLAAALRPSTQETPAAAVEVAETDDVIDERSEADRPNEVDHRGSSDANARASEQLQAVGHGRGVRAGLSRQ